jgi:putative chitinase
VTIYNCLGLVIFTKYFKDVLAEGYARNPEKIANRVSGGRMGNGSESTGEGYKFRGRGYIQLTGKDNYSAFSKFIGEDCVANPDLVSDKYPMDSAIWFFDKNKLWDICDKGKTPDIVTLVTKRVNGGSHGIEDRLAKFNTFISLLA